MNLFNNLLTYIYRDSLTSDGLNCRPFSHEELTRQRDHN